MDAIPAEIRCAATSAGQHRSSRRRSGGSVHGRRVTRFLRPNPRPRTGSRKGSRPALESATGPRASTSTSTTTCPASRILDCPCQVDHARPRSLEGHLLCLQMRSAHLIHSLASPPQLVLIKLALQKERLLHHLWLHRSRKTSLLCLCFIGVSERASRDATPLWKVL